MKKFFVAATITLGAVGVVAGPAAATHSHHIQTPVSCVDRNGQGFGTGQFHETIEGAPIADPGDTTFHERIHKGTPGTFAFEQEKNPVSVDGGLCTA